MGAKFIDVELGNNFLMVIGVLVNHDRSASNHHIYVQFTAHLCELIKQNTHCRQAYQASLAV